MQPWADATRLTRQALIIAQTFVDKDDPSAAVLYATILSERIEVILKLPQQPLRHYATHLPRPQVEQTLKSLCRNLAEPDALRQSQIQLQ